MKRTISAHLLAFAALAACGNDAIVPAGGASPIGGAGGSAGGEAPSGGAGPGGAGGALVGGSGDGAGGGGANFNCEPPEGAVPQLALTAVASPADNIGIPAFALSAPGDADRLFIVNLLGTIRILDRTTGIVDPVAFLDLTSVVQIFGERGLLGVAFHPDYPNNGRFFVHYTQLGTGSTVVEEYARMTPGVASPTPIATILYEPQPFANHNGGTIAFDRDGLLNIFLGDGGSGGDPNGNGQNPLVRLGKVLRYDVDSSPAPTMAGGYPGALPDVWAIGLRNPWRASFDFCSGDLYIGDVGETNWEEVDFVAQGSSGVNFGWNDLEGTHCFLTPDCDAAGKTMPIHEYDHVGSNAAVVGGYVYRGSAIPALRGRYFFADTYQSKVWSLRVEEGVATDWMEHTELAQGLTLVSFGYDNDGELYVGDYNGTLYRIDQAPP